MRRIKHIIAALIIVAPFLLFGNAKAAKPADRLEKQEECERLCVDCASRGQGPHSLCMGLYRLCCAYYDGQRYPDCGCRVELKNDV